MIKITLILYLVEINIKFLMCNWTRCHHDRRWWSTITYIL